MKPENKNGDKPRVFMVELLSLCNRRILELAGELRKNVDLTVYSKQANTFCLDGLQWINGLYDEGGKNRRCLFLQQNAAADVLAGEMGTLRHPAHLEL